MAGVHVCRRECQMTDSMFTNACTAVEEVLPRFTEVLRRNPGVTATAVGSWTFPDGSSHHVTRVVLRNILVLKSAPQVAETAKLGPTQDTSAVQLRLTDAQSQKMMYVYKNPTADWYLQLRPPTKSSDSPNTFQEDHTMLVDGPGRRPH